MRNPTGALLVRSRPNAAVVLELALTAGPWRT